MRVIIILTLSTEIHTHYNTNAHTHVDIYTYKWAHNSKHRPKKTTHTRIEIGDDCVYGFNNSISI